jgi:hypothetical protein
VRPSRRALTALSALATVGLLPFVWRIVELINRGFSAW